MACLWYDDVNTVYAAVLSILQAAMAACMEDFDRSISYTLQCLGCATMTLKLEQRTSVKPIYDGKDLFSGSQLALVSNCAIIVNIPRGLRHCNDVT